MQQILKNSRGTALGADDARMPARAKLRDSLARGVLLAWVLGPNRKSVTTYDSESSAVTLHADDVLDAGDVLSGFRYVVGRIFD